MPRWIQAVLGLVLLTLLVLTVVVLTHWPYRRGTVAQSLQNSFDSQVSVASYRLKFFPGPGFVADGVTLRRHGAANVPPLATVVLLDATSSYATILFAPRRFQTIRIVGLHVQIPPAGTTDANSEGAKKKSTMVVEHLIADGAQLDIARADEKPLHFDIHRLRLDDVSTTRAIRFSTSLLEPLLRGEVQAEGKLGPFDTHDIGKTPVAATYKLAGLDLGDLHDLSGLVSSSGNFAGPLEHIAVEGSVEAPNFRFKQAHPIHLRTKFKAIVNGTNGDIALAPVVSRFDKTTVSSDGDIADQPKVASLNLQVEGGRIQDLLSIFVAQAPPMSGIVTLAAKAVLPSSKEPFIKRLRMEADFGIGGGRFTKPDMRYKVDAFSERASEEKPPKDDPNPPPVISNIKGHVILTNGIAKFTNLSFSVPGAAAVMNGTFSLLDKRINLVGDMHMENDVSHATTGMKSILLKPFIPFFKKKNKTSTIPMQVTGTYDHAVIGPRLMPKIL